MKAYINIKNDSDLHSHQTLNKRIGLMKRGNGRSPTHHFSFGERFDETLMKDYFISCQYMTDFRSADRQGETDVTGEKKRQPMSADITADAAAGFWETKSHSSLGRFLHAPLMLMLKTPQ